MKLRSGKEYFINTMPAFKYEVNIDFDGASKEWRKNKISVGNGQFIYK